MRLGKFATVNPRYSASEPAVTRRNTVSPVQTTGNSPGSTPDVCSRASMDGSSSGLSHSCGTRLRVRYSRIRRVSDENPEPTSRRDAAALLSRRSRRAINALRMMSLSLVSVASKCWSACLETTTTSPGSTTRAETKTRSPVTRLSSPTKRPGPCRVMTRSVPSACTTISTAPDSTA